MQTCSSCGQENPDNARFCLACGSPLGQAAPREERRIISVLFVDLVGFTARAERLDPEDVRAILTPYHDCVRREIESLAVSSRSSSATRSWPCSARQRLTGTTLSAR